MNATARASLIAAAATAALTLASVAVGAAVYRRMADGKRAERLPD